jgi:phosphomannomutase
MADELIISISGMRGIVGQNLTEPIATAYGSAFGTFLRRSAAAAGAKPTVCLGRDSRKSGPMLASAVSEGLNSVGIDVIDVGLVTTPTASIMTTNLNCAGGVMITASHNPIEYNGIKLFLANGMTPPSEQAAQIRQIFTRQDFDLLDSKDHGSVVLNTQAYSVHINKVLQIVDKDLIASKKYKVVLDSVNGAGAPITKKLLAELGCETIAINDDPSGIFEHAPEPAAENLMALCDIVKAKKADIGFAQDPDADRLAIVDENGRYIGEEYTLALAAKYVFSKQSGVAATNLATSRMIDDIANAANSKVIRTAVGEANVADAMLKNDCIIGGEGNGGVIDLRVGTTRDSLVAIAIVLELMAETGKTVSRLVSEIPAYVMIKDKFTADGVLAAKMFEAARAHFLNAEVDMTDGCRLDFEDGWISLRTSNTEPIIRIFVEAKDKAAADRYMDAMMDIRSRVT